MGLPLALVVAGCSAAHYRKSADRDAYRTIREKTPLVKNMDPNFTIEHTNRVHLEGLPVTTNLYESLGADAEKEQEARVLNLEAALDLAVQHSRAYQARKESLYLASLRLTATRHTFTPLFSSSASGRFSGQTDLATSVVYDPLTGQFKQVTSDNLVETHKVNASGSVGVDYLIRDVGKLTVSFTTSFLRFLGGGQQPSSSLNATLVRPLLRDAGYMTQMESLTQGERDLLYALRDFTRYRRDFSVQIATAYYNVLSIRDSVRNNYANLQSSRRNADRTRALANEGRVTQSDLGRLAQQELTSESAWINAIRSYKSALDNFKLQLGLSVNENLVLDDTELADLRIRHPLIDVDDAIRVAVAARFDYLNLKDQLVDSDRKLKLAANMLKPRVDLTSSVDLNSNPNKTTGFQPPDIDRYNYSVGLNVDPGLDKTADRNAYRSALITREQAARSVEEEEDTIKVQVRDGWRTLDSAKRNYEIAEIGVKLAERRVEEQTLLAELGRAKAQDQVDAQNDLVSSKNQRTQALVAHTIARLNFWNNMGILYIKDRGQWEEPQDEKTK